MPHGHWNTTTFLAGLRHDRLVAPLALDGPINGAAFRAWVEQFLGPTLAPGDIVIADNLGSHKVSGVRETIEARGASMMFLPGYSPDLNPIEQVFAKLEATGQTRGAANQAKAVANHRILPRTILINRCHNYLKNAGYGQST